MSGLADSMLARRPAKSAAAFRTISEVASDLEVPQHVLRFWETKFSQVRPLKRGGGRRYYRPEDVDLLRRIRKLLYSDGYTIKGVQKLLREGNARPAPRPGDPIAPMSVPSFAAAAPIAAPAPPQAGAQAAEPPRAAPRSDARRAELEAVLAELESMRALLGEA
jgi:DNA-binding transcriptional MerR regulator